MQTILKLALFLTVSLFVNVLYAQQWKQMMDDPSVNVYDVIDAAETYFETVDKDAKGSGWKGYQRWRSENEPKFYPSGDRRMVDPFFATNAYKSYLKSNPSENRSLGDERWKELGPYYIEEVTGHYSCGLGRVESFYVDRSDSDRIYLGSRSGGFWKTLDGGETWTGATTGFLIAGGVNSIAVSPTNADSVLINLRNPQNGVTHGIYRSADAGDTWEVTRFNPVELGWGGLGTNDRITEVAYHPFTPGLVFVASSKGLFRSDDDLATWSGPIIVENIRKIAFHPVDPQTIYVVTNNNSVIYVSNDGGLTFSPSNLISGNGSTIRIAVSAACPECVFINSSDGVWESTDRGQNFSLISTPGIPNYGAFAVSDVSTNYMLTGDLDVYMSQDGGQNFDKATYWSSGNASYNASGTYVHADIRGAQSIDGVFWINTDGFLCKSDDNGASWEIFEGQSIRENYNLGVSQSNSYRTICGSQDNGTSIKTENSWVEYYGADGMEGLIHPLNDDWMIGSFQFGGRRRTKDGGVTQDGVTPGGGDGAWIAPMAYDPNNPMVIYDFRGSVYRSEDFGSTWQRLATIPLGGIVQHAAIAENNSDNIVLTYTHNVEISRNGGVSFTNIRSNLPQLWATDIAFAPANDSIIVVTYGNYENDGNKVFITFDQGGEWQNITHNLGDLPVRSVVIDHTAESNIYIGTELGVYRKAMSDESWTLFSPGLPSVTVRELEINYGSNTLRAATWGRGLWEVALEGRSEYPSILVTEITEKPTDVKPQSNNDQTVTSTISYRDSLTSVYAVWSADTVIFDHSIKMENITDSTWVTIAPIPAQEEGVKVYFKVIAVGSNGDTTETYRFMYETRPFAHCTSFGNLAYSTAVTRVVFNDIDNASGKTLPYSDYTDTIASNIEFGPIYDLSVNLNTDGDYPIYAKAWIDWNKDADFDDEGEEYDLGLAQNTVDGPTDGSPLQIQVPLDARPGRTTMRVACKYNSAPGRCETFFDGEVEDYAIVIDPVTITEEVNAAICITDSLFLEGQWRDTAGVYYDTIKASAIVDSVIITTLDVFTELELNQELTGCDSLSLFNGMTFYENTDTTLFLSGDGVGCDTTLILQINIAESGATEISETSCGPYTSPAGNTYSVSGVYQDILTNQNGCDSIITINLDVNYVDVSVIQQSATLTASAIGAEYQWIDCETGLAIDSATQRIFTPATSGEYAVVVSQGECTDTSECYQVTSVSVVESTFDGEIQFYPNPTSGRIFIDLGGQYKGIRTKVMTMDGRLIGTELFDQSSKFSLDIEGPSGYYMIELQEVNGKRATFRVLKS